MENKMQISWWEDEGLQVWKAPRTFSHALNIHVVWGSVWERKSGFAMGNEGFQVWRAPRAFSHSLNIQLVWGSVLERKCRDLHGKVMHWDWCIEVDAFSLRCIEIDALLMHWNWCMRFMHSLRLMRWDRCNEIDAMRLMQSIVMHCDTRIEIDAMILMQLELMYWYWCIAIDATQLAHANEEENEAGIWDVFKSASPQFGQYW